MDELSLLTEPEAPLVLRIEGEMRDAAYLRCESPPPMPLFNEAVQRELDAVGGRVDVRSAECLLRLQTKGLNTLFKLGYLTNDEYNEVRHERRRLKNKLYARNARRRERLKRLTKECWDSS
jgi:hypothetical protein